MDQRGREAEKRYRSSVSDINYKTISLTLDKTLIKRIEKEVGKTEDKNMSKFIEELVFNSKTIKDVPARRKSKTFPIKKTFTFTEEFVKTIKESGNMSLFVEKVLKRKFDLK